MRASIPWLFDHYASQIRTLEASFQAFFHGFCARVLPVIAPLIMMSFCFNTPFLFEIVLVTGAP